MNTELIERLRRLAVLRVSNTESLTRGDLTEAADVIEASGAACIRAVEAAKSLAKQAIKAERERDELIASELGFREDNQKFLAEIDALRAEIEALKAERDALADELKAARGQEPVAWVTPARYGSTVAFPKRNKPEDWDDEMGDWYCIPFTPTPRADGRDDSATLGRGLQRHPQGPRLE